MQMIQNFNVGDVYLYCQKFHVKEDYNNPRKFQDFISERPVVIIGTNVDGYGSVRVVEMTTQDEKCGIRVMMASGRISVIKPYKIHTITRTYLDTYYGRLPDDLIKVLLECVAYHMGFSDKIPEYMKIPNSTSLAFSNNEEIEYTYCSKSMDNKSFPDSNTHEVVADAKCASTKPLEFTDREGDPVALIDSRELRYDERVDKAIEMYLNTTIPVATIAKEAGISVSTIYNVIKKRGIPTHDTRKPKKTEPKAVEIIHTPMMLANSCRPYEMPDECIRSVVLNLSISDVYRIGRKCTITDLMDDYEITYEQAKELKSYCFKISQKNEKAMYKNFKSGYKFDRVDEWDIIIVANRQEDILLSKGISKESAKLEKKENLLLPLSNPR